MVSEHAHVSAVKAEWARHRRGQAHYPSGYSWDCERCMAFKAALRALRRAIREARDEGR